MIMDNDGVVNNSFSSFLLTWRQFSLGALLLWDFFPFCHVGWTPAGHFSSRIAAWSTPVTLDFGSRITMSEKSPLFDKYELGCQYAIFCRHTGPPFVYKRWPDVFANTKNITLYVFADTPIAHSPRLWMIGKLWSDVVIHLDSPHAASRRINTHRPASHCPLLSWKWPDVLIPLVSPQRSLQWMCQTQPPGVLILIDLLDVVH